MFDFHKINSCKSVLLPVTDQCFPPRISSKDVYLWRANTPPLLLSQIQPNPHTFPHTFEAAEAQTPHSTLTLSWLLIPTLPLHDVISPKFSLFWRHITETCLVMTSYHRNLPCYDVISQKLALLWRHITETCLVMTSYHRNLPLIPQVPVTCIAKEELFNWNDRQINWWHNKGNATINHLQ